MVFSSTIFLFIFLPLVFILYFISHRKIRNSVLLIASLLFYAWGEPRFIFIMLASIFINYIFGLLIDKYKDKIKMQKLILLLMVVFNLSIFFVYKYLNFTITNLNYLFNDIIPQTNVILPIGISFYTFQAMSYVFDIYRQKGEVQRNPLNVALYIMFFPQLIAGPIVRYETISKEISYRNETVSDFSRGISRFIIGLFKKVCISNIVAVIADYAFGFSELSQLSVAMAWFGIICYSLQIFFDFSGYSDMAIGLGLMFGFHFDENFKYPYISKSVSEFWRRWHISLGTWFRDYVYIPLGGSKVKKSRLLLNLFIVWSLTGIWHGASWNFLCWGLFYFILLVFEKYTGYPGKFKNVLVIQVYRLFTLLCVMLGWVLFRSENIIQAKDYIKAMCGLTNNALINISDKAYFSQYIIIIIVSIIFCMPIADYVKRKISTSILLIDILKKVTFVVMFIVAMSFVVSNSYNPFIYFNF